MASDSVRFRKRPVVIEAVQFNGHNTADIECFVGQVLSMGRIGTQPWTLTIPTLEGRHIASAGDWIIKGTKGEFYPCKPDIFAEIYELATQPDPLSTEGRKCDCKCTCDTGLQRAVCPFHGEPMCACPHGTETATETALRLGRGVGADDTGRW